ncbi:MAG: hypothetical protein JWR12_3187 [Mucilaginibacter sp.]|nr:hypothetical protein [Mucilaginibacter sp.]
MNYPLVSVIIPAYNHGQYITYTLNSVIDDTYFNKEIVIINDGSRDNTDDVVNAWIKINNTKIPIIYIKRENKGVCATLNELIRLSNGKYLLPIASDDLFYGNTITQRVEILENNEREGKLVLISDAVVIDENNNVIKLSSMEMNNGNKLKFKTNKGILEEMITKPSTVGAISLINKSIYNTIGYYPEDLPIEDWFFFQRAAAIKAIIFWDKIVSQYRIHSNNMSGFNIPFKRQLEIYKAVKTSVYRNLKWFPSIYFKYLGLKKLIEIEFDILKLNLKNHVWK